MELLEQEVKDSIMLVPGQYIIDRFEEGYAVLETETLDFIDVLKSQLPRDVCEGDVLDYRDGKFTINKGQTKKRSDKIDKLMDSLFID